MNVGNRISEMRKQKKMTQQELAKKLFISDKTISSWEANRTEPSLELLIKMSEIFSCNVSYLIYGNVVKSDIETEIKIEVTKEEYKNLEIYLNNEAMYLCENKQTDTYYQPTYRIL